MCGICCAVTLCSQRAIHDFLSEDILCHLRRRGPDRSQQLIKTVSDPFYECLFSGHVLHLRGLVTPQPLEDANSNIFLWNGEIFNGLHVGDLENDTEVMFHRLGLCSSEMDILSLFSSVRGPWSFIYYEAPRHSLWFGRDYFGRRSLLWQFSNEVDSAFCLTSVSGGSESGNQWQEVPASGIFKIDLKACAATKSLSLTLFPWKYSSHEVQPDWHCPQGSFQDLDADPGTRLCCFDVPDRITGRAGLIYPLDTVLDDSIGCAIWFASRGEGFISNQGELKAYKSPAKVLGFLFCFLPYV